MTRRSLSFLVFRKVVVSLQLMLGTLLSNSPLSAATAQPSRGLPAGWSITSRPEDNLNGWRYDAPINRKGTYLHGTAGELFKFEALDEGKSAKACAERTGNYPDPPFGLKVDEFWYYEADHQGVILLKKNEIAGYDNKCEAIVRTTFAVQRVVIGKDSFTSFTQTGVGWIAETHQFSKHRQTERGDVPIGYAWDPLTTLAVRKVHLDDSDRGGKVNGIPTHCVAYSAPPDAGATQCWLAGNGPGKGIIVFEQVWIAGTPDVGIEIDDAKDGIWIDGLLFEWDLQIRHN